MYVAKERLEAATRFAGALLTVFMDIDRGDDVWNDHHLNLLETVVTDPDAATLAYAPLCAAILNLAAELGRTQGRSTDDILWPLVDKWMATGQADA